MSEITYRQVGKVLLPNIELTEEEKKPLGKYGRMRKKYLQEHRPILFNRLILEGALFPHLLEIDEEANRWLDEMMPGLAKAAGATEELKAKDQLKWVGLMNNCKAQAEEIISAELIYK